MVAMLLAYNEAGDVIATLDCVVARDADGSVLGLVDFAALEAAGGEHTDVWNVTGANGSKVWPEWIGDRAHEFRVELEGPPGAKRIAALVHRASGHRRERAAIEAAIAAVEPDANGVRDLRSIVGGPMRPLPLDVGGRTMEGPGGIQKSLPLVGSASRD